MKKWVVAGLGTAIIALSMASCQAYTLTPLPAGATVAALADRGVEVFINRCARCHGLRGQGVVGTKLIGAESHVQHFANAAELNDYILEWMPKDRPGALTEAECHEVLCYLLVENGVMNHDMVFRADDLAAFHLGEETHPH